MSYGDFIISTITNSATSADIDLILEKYRLNNIKYPDTNIYYNANSLFDGSVIPENNSPRTIEMFGGKTIDINEFIPKYNAGVGNFDINSIYPNFSSDYTGNSPITSSYNTSNYEPPKGDSDLFNRKVRLINKYATDNDTSYSDKISKIRTDMQGDYEIGCEKLDELIKTFDKEKLYKSTTALYTKDAEAKKADATKIATKWATEVGNETGDDFKVDFSGVNKNNILDVLGAYITNDKFALGKDDMWNTLVQDNLDNMSKVLLEKAYMIIEAEKTSEEEKTAIKTAIETFRGNKTASGLYSLFTALRKIEAENNDTNVQARYGVPEDMRKDNGSEVDILVESKFATEETKTWDKTEV